MRQDDRPRTYDVLARWLLGTALVSWRYMWETMPFHRRERSGCSVHPPELLPGVLDERVQRAADGHGPMFHRVFRVSVANARLSPADLIARVRSDFGHFVPSEVIRIRAVRVSEDRLCVGDEIVVEMPGPWNGPVRVVHADETCLRLVTLRGHLEAGQVQFCPRRGTEDGELVFEIELWARPASPLVHLLYSHLRIAKEVQLNMWVRFCQQAASTVGGRPVDGVSILTERA